MDHVPRLAVTPGHLEALRKADHFSHGHVQRLQSTSGLSAMGGIGQGPALPGMSPASSPCPYQHPQPLPQSLYGYLCKDQLEQLTQGISSAAAWDPKRQLEEVTSGLSSPEASAVAFRQDGGGGVLPSSLFCTRLMLSAAVVIEPRDVLTEPEAGSAPCLNDPVEPSLNLVVRLLFSISKRGN